MIENKYPSEKHKFNESESIHTEKGTVINCITCGFKHLYPFPNLPELKEFYEKKYIDSLEKINIEEKINTLENLLIDKEKKNILDIGCSDGSLLSIFKQKNWDVLGIEPGKTAANIAKGRNLPILECFAENASTQLKNMNLLNCFSVVNLSYILEHILNPIELLEIIKNDFLAKDGILSITVPNDFNAFQESAVNSLNIPKWWIAIPDHINYFNFASLTSLIKRIGFSIEHVTTSFPIEMFLLFGDNYIGNPEIGKMCHQKRINFENALHKSGNTDLLKNFYYSFANLGIGREIQVYARKL